MARAETLTDFQFASADRLMVNVKTQLAKYRVVTN
jgi:hypothetical protein